MILGVVSSLAIRVTLYEVKSRQDTTPVWQWLRIAPNTKNMLFKKQSVRKRVKLIYLKYLYNTNKKELVYNW